MTGQMDEGENKEGRCTYSLGKWSFQKHFGAEAHFLREVSHNIAQHDTAQHTALQHMNRFP